MFIKDDARVARTNYREELIAELAKSKGLSNVVKEGERERFPDLHELPKLLNKVQIKFDKELDALYKRNGFDGLNDFWKVLDKNKQDVVVERAFTATAITLGGLLTIANSKSVGRFLIRHDEKNAPQSR